MRRSGRTLIARIALAAAVAIGITTSAACGGNSCGLGQLRSLTIPPGAVSGTATTTPQFFDVDLSASDIQQVNLDSTANPGQPGHVDAFLTTSDCTKLFAGDYTGTPTSPLCTIYVGPVTAGGVSSRVTLSPGRYRVFAQPWTTNVSATTFGFDVVIWGQNCSSAGLSPGAGF
jgi:hypothetical protein